MSSKFPGTGSAVLNALTGKVGTNRSMLKGIWLIRQQVENPLRRREMTTQQLANGDEGKTEWVGIGAPTGVSLQDEPAEGIEHRLVVFDGEQVAVGRHVAVEAGDDAAPLKAELLHHCLMRTYGTPLIGRLVWRTTRRAWAPLYVRGLLGPVSARACS